MRSREWRGANGWLWILVWLLIFAGCSRQKRGEASLGLFRMGERVQVGPLVYTVLDTEWRDQLGEGLEAHTPQHRFLLIRLSVTNSGIRETDIPPMALIGTGGEIYAEQTQGQGVPEWLGYLRSVKPAATEHGRVVFDVPPGSYRLRLSAPAEDEQEPQALIEIPYQVPPAPRLPVGPPVPPGY